ncbi:MAG: response regulator transcription factor [Chloroflexi bacterium]|nr:response regulator transcription factor [Chloroflexota bacterium]
MIRVLIVDDHQLVRQGFRLLLERADGMQVVGEARDGLEGIEMIERTSPDVVLMDVQMPRLNGLDATARIHAKHADLPVLIVAMSSEEAQVRQALRNGAKGYIRKNDDYAELLAAIHALHAGKSYLSPAIATILSHTR